MTTTRRIDGVAVRAIRERRGLMPSEVADVIGLSRSFYSRIESGERGASPRTARAIASALSVPLHKIVRTDAPAAAAA